MSDLTIRYSGHHLVRSFGATSLVTVPVLMQDGTVFGTLCAVGRGQDGLADTSVALMELFARLLVEHLGERGELTELFAGHLVS